MPELKWDKLLNHTRLADLHGKTETMETGIGRTEIERDYDRILFATPTRRLADKTQVFPLEENDSVRTRLTHSHEVSNLARSIGVRLAFDNAEEVFGSGHEVLRVTRTVPPLLAAVGLAHDLGNPPFGHQGEDAIQAWFKRNLPEEQQYEDFVQFDGNAQTFRLLTQLQVLNDRFGFNLTCGTLAALLKYPSIYGTGEKFGFKKYGVFQSEAETVNTVWQQTGLEAGERHPLAYVMEACDDIAYSVIDAEDTVKKGYASFYDLMDHLENQAGADPVVQAVLEKSRSKNKEFKQQKLSSRQLNDISMQMFRVKAIAVMIVAATDTFVGNLTAILNGTIPQGFELIKNSRCAALCKAAKGFDARYGFQHRDVLKLELRGSNYISKMMDYLWAAIRVEGKGCHPFERFVFNDISENYRLVYERSIKGDYEKCQLLCDAVSGMTEKFLIRKCDEYAALEKCYQPNQ
ncbi:MAG: dNTP triphosphohydrolase [Pseudohongiella sp.]|nr:dNTP triphosphohydrolase [Pseudohongiella sp.]